MTDINHTYRRLAKHLNRTRKSLFQVCKEYNIDIDDIEDDILDQYTQECSHCGIWGSDHRLDLDDFPICKVCYDLVGP